MANLEDLLGHINFSEEVLEEIEEALERVTDTIELKAEDNKIPNPISFRKFGSLARKTKIKPLDDVDILYIVGEAENASSNSNIITKCDFTFDDQWQEPSTNISSSYLLNNTKSAIKETYSSSDIRKNNEVINVYLSSYEVGFDIVPAFYVTNKEYYLIPEGGGGHYWKKTKPKVGEDFLYIVTEKHNGNIRNTIKIIKYWFKKKKIVSPGSFHLECVLYNAFYAAKYNQETLENALYFAFTHINFENYLKSCLDPSGLGENIDSNLTSDDIKKIEEEALYARDLLSNVSEFVEYIEPELD